jgi:outer membrane biosynthesis protein TonB
MPAGVTLVDPAVFLQVLIDVDGGFTRPVVVGGPDVLTAAAVEAIATWKAEPVRIAGQPVVSAVTLRVAFTPVAD